MNTRELIVREIEKRKAELAAAREKFNFASGKEVDLAIEEMRLAEARLNNSLKMVRMVTCS
jgi:hypothetical protein